MHSIAIDTFSSLVILSAGLFLFYAFALFVIENLTVCNGYAMSTCNFVVGCCGPSPCNNVPVA